MLFGQRLVGHLHDFLIGSYLLPPWLSALGVSGRNATRNAGGNPLGIHAIHVFPAWPGCGSFSMSGPETSYCYLCVKWLLVWIGWVCELPSQVTGPHTTGLPPMGLQKKPSVTYRQLIWKKILLPVSLRKQEPVEVWQCWAHMTIPAPSVLAMCWGLWSYIVACALNW